MRYIPTSSVRRVVLKTSADGIANLSPNPTEGAAFHPLLTSQCDVDDVADRTFFNQDTAVHIAFTECQFGMPEECYLNPSIRKADDGPRSVLTLELVSDTAGVYYNEMAVTDQFLEHSGDQHGDTCALDFFSC